MDHFNDYWWLAQVGFCALAAGFFACWDGRLCFIAWPFWLFSFLFVFQLAPCIEHLFSGLNEDDLIYASPLAYSLALMYTITLTFGMFAYRLKQAYAFAVGMAFSSLAYLFGIFAESVSSSVVYIQAIAAG